MVQSERSSSIKSVKYLKNYLLICCLLKYLHILSWTFQHILIVSKTFINLNCIVETRARVELHSRDKGEGWSTAN